ncbi:hypothetical protein RHGRI_038556 [Rhododendron griersonianum]|uniref:GST C-terminal domain-containing protein n=1 Tax=Rhododendron griersonianum TaxID=479676 RepID=A0AAV6HLV6_9ERIC|nr:hypothetical protein RHGRI_038556 [Rhododendron griersonianum]
MALFILLRHYSNSGDRGLGVQLSEASSSWKLWVEEPAISALKRSLSGLSTHLASNTYLVVHSMTLVDIIMTVNLYKGCTRLMTKNFTSQFPHVERYFWTMVNQPNFSKILGEVKQTEQVPPVTSTKKPSEQKKLLSQSRKMSQRKRRRSQQSPKKKLLRRKRRHQNPNLPIY